MHVIAPVAELSALLVKLQQENEQLRLRMVFIAFQGHFPIILSFPMQSRSEVNEEVAALQTQHQERLKKVIEAHDQDLSLLQVYQSECYSALDVP